MEAIVKSHPVLLTFALYLLWVAATFLYEGQLRTFLRPQETGLRTRYTLVVNWVIALVLGGWLLSLLVGAKFISPELAGFQSAPHALIAIAAGVILGLGAYVVLRPPARNPLIVLNGYAQVLTVSIAEVLICWGLVGTTAGAWLQRLHFPFPAVLAALVASLAFGLYHIAHSPPFNSIRMIALLSVIGLITSVFFIVSRDIYGTIVFHNFFGVLGVLRALQASDKLASYQRLLLPLLLMALVSVVLLLLIQVVLL